MLPRSGLKGCFDSRGVHFTGAGSPLALRLVAYGRDRLIGLVHATSPQIRGNRVSYAHASLTEWWRVLPVGFEQGFTIARRPAGHGELRLALDTSRQDAGVRDGALGWGKLRYGQLVVTDANGKVVPAILKTKGDRILIAVNDAHAAYPLTVDPLVWLEEQKVTESDGAPYDEFGNGVAISDTTAIIGAPDVAVNGNPFQGVVYVFNKSNGIWTQTAELTASDGAAFNNFGNTLALSGTTALIVAPGATVNGNSSQGAAYVFTESDGTWTQTAKLTASDGAANDDFGSTVAILGTTALVGEVLATVNGNSFAGAAYVFSESNGSWTQTAKLTANDGNAYDEFGWSLSLSGASALVGAVCAPSNGTVCGPGKAYVFEESNGSWSQTAELTPSDGISGDSFGAAVALDGSNALIGAQGASPNGNTWQGAAYMFTKTNGTWTQTQKLTASDAALGDRFGVPVVLSGTTAFIGAYYDTINGNSGQGAVYEFDQAENGTWTQTAEITASDGGESDHFGIVALSGKTLLVGAPCAPYDPTNFACGPGWAYFFDLADLGLAVSAPQSAGQGQTYVSQTIATNDASAASPAVSATIAVPAAASFVSATASQGSCDEAAGIVTCDFGQISGNAGTATANVTLKAAGNVGDTIDNTASVAKATPALSASAPTTITAGSACPEGYTEYDGNLDAGKRAHSPIYRAPAGTENAILTGPTGFQLYAVFQNAQGRKTYRVPGNEIHRRAPAGTYTWAVKAGDTGGAYMLCALHP